MNILVTGGAGFIGSHFVKQLINKHPEDWVVTLDLLTYAGNCSNLEGIPPEENHTFIRGDIRDSELVESVFDRHGIDAVVNFAAESHVDRSIEASGIFLSTNVMGVQVLLEAARRHWRTDGIEGSSWRSGTRFLQISTDEVYGSLEGDGLFTELSPLAHNNPYAASKGAADLLVRSYGMTYGLPVNITRSSNNYGPNQHSEKLIPQMILRAGRNEPLPVYGDGQQIREWLFVEDHCCALEKVLYHGVNGEVYNIGSGNARTNLEVVRFILKHMEKSESLITHVADRPGHDFCYTLDSDKIQRELGWKATLPFEEGLCRTIAWYCR